LSTGKEDLCWFLKEAVDAWDAEEPELKNSRSVH
jgi:hypothetical protein